MLNINLNREAKHSDAEVMLHLNWLKIIIENSYGVNSHCKI